MHAFLISSALVEPKNHLLTERRVSVYPLSYYARQSLYFTPLFMRTLFLASLKFSNQNVGFRMSFLPLQSSSVDLRQLAFTFLHSAWCCRELEWKSPPVETELNGWVTELVDAAVAAQATTQREQNKFFYHQLQLMELVRCGRLAGLALTAEQAGQFTQDLLADRLLRVAGNNLDLDPVEYETWSRDRRHYVVKCALDSEDLPERLRGWLTPGRVFPEPLPGYLDQAYLRTCTAEMLPSAGWGCRHREEKWPEAVVEPGAWGDTRCYRKRSATAP